MSTEQDKNAEILNLTNILNNLLSSKQVQFTSMLNPTSKEFSNFMKNIAAMAKAAEGHRNAGNILGLNQIVNHLKIYTPPLDRRDVKRIENKYTALVKRFQFATDGSKISKFDTRGQARLVAMRTELHKIVTHAYAAYNVQDEQLLNMHLKAYDSYRYVAPEVPDVKEATEALDDVTTAMTDVAIAPVESLAVDLEVGGVDGANTVSGDVVEALKDVQAAVIDKPAEPDENGHIRNEAGEIIGRQVGDETFFKTVVIGPGDLEAPPAEVHLKLDSAFHVDETKPAEEENGLKTVVGNGEPAREFDESSVLVQ